jgi:Mg2+ and Co2+ transporter CorA
MAPAAKAEETAAAQHKLNVLAAMTFPVLALAAVFGMNLVYGFESPSPILFWFVLGCGVMVGLLAKDWVTKN